MSFLRKSYIFSPIRYFGHLFQNVSSKRKQQLAVIGLATALIYYKLDKALKPPKELGHIPYFGYIQLLLSILRGEKYVDRALRTSIPEINSSENRGIYLKPGKSRWLVHISDPEAVKQVLLRQEFYPKAIVFQPQEGTFIYKFLGGPNILLLNGERWKAHRQVANPAFARSLPVKLFGKVTLSLFEKMDTLDQEPIDWSNLTRAWALDALGMASLDFDFGATKDENSEWVQIYRRVDSALQNPLYFFFPSLDSKYLWMFPKRQKEHVFLDRFIGMLDDIIEKRRSGVKMGQTHNPFLDENEKDLLTLMLESEMEGNGKMTNEELRSNICLFFMAGHDSTANSVSSIVYYLSKYQDVQQRAREEILEILGNESVDIIPTMDQCKAMKYVNQVIKETLRIDGPVPEVLPREAAENTELAGKFIPKGTYVVVNSYDIHHSNKIWENPYEFNPDRFLNDDISGMKWTPFGNGARQCIGMNFSLYQQRVLIAMLLKKYTFTLPEDSIHKDKLILNGIGILGPRNLNIKFKKRY
ncbi:cytochrome P450 [Backusella circina FSU 941]|nr:cytochrome P450 [Backusella circina FSU 941]